MVQDRAGKKIKVLLLDDSAIAIAVLKKILQGAPDIDIVAAVNDPFEALKLIPVTDPDVICSDLHMPGMDGLEFTIEVMDRFPRPILVVSVSVEQASHNVFKLLEAGAVDVFPKPRGGSEAEYLEKKDELVSKIRILSGVRVFRRRRETSVAAPVRAGLMRPGIKAVAIGASTGGPQALQQIFSAIPEDLPVPVFCVQHIGAGFLDGLLEWLQSISRLRFKTASEGEQPRPSTVYFPKEGMHMLIGADGRLKSSDGAPVEGHRPSINATFNSVARYYGPSSMGVLLTGMGSDGAEGMKAIAAAGGVTIAQDEATSVIFSMPMHAIRLNAASYILPLNDIARLITAKIKNAGKGA